MIITDGVGTKKSAKVDSNNRLWTKAVSVTNQSQRSVDGYAYNINTGDISFTDGSEYAAFYIKYTGTTYFLVESLAVGIGALSGTVSNPATITMIRNPTTGTIIDNASAVAMNQNRRFDNTSVLSATAYKGAQGYTFTNGSDIAQFYQNGNGRLFAGIDFILGPQSSLGINIQLNATGGGTFYVALIGNEGE